MRPEQHSRDNHPEQGAGGHAVTDRSELLALMRKDDGDAGSPRPASIYEDIRHVFPRFVWESVEEHMKRIEETAPGELTDAKKLLIAHALASELHHNESLDSLTELYTQKYMKDILTDALIERLNDSRCAQYGSVARISIDVNGLKAVNDLNNGQHSQGDRYLQLIAETLKQSPTVDALRLEGARVILAREHGDDFSVTIIGASEANYGAEQLSRITESLQREIEAAELPEDLIPLAELEARLGPAPSGFRFYPSAAVGARSVEEILSNGITGRNQIFSHDPPARIAQKIMGELIDVSEEYMNLNKKEQKQRLSLGTENERYYLKAISPRDQELATALEKQQRTIEDLRTALEEKDRIINELRGLA